MSRFSDEAVTLAVLGRRFVRRYPFPGNEAVEIGIRALSDAECDAARLEAAEFCKARRVDLVVDPEFLDRAIKRCILLRATVNPEKHEEPFFASHAEVTHLDNLLVHALYELYCAHCQNQDPLAYASEEEVRALIAQLGKSNESAARLSLYDRPSLVSFLLSMAAMLRATSPTPRSNTG